MKLRPYQNRLLTEWNRIIRKPRYRDNSHHHVYIQSPTGTGKTLIALAIGAGRRGRKAFITPRFTLNEQNRDEGVDSDMAKGFQFYTIQSLHRLVQREDIRIDDLFFDECHLYTSGEDLRMVSTILERVRPKTVTYISATTSGLNEDKLGPRHGYTALYRYEDAYRDGFLHPVTLVRYNSSTNLKMKKLVEDMNETLRDSGKTTDDLINEIAQLTEPEDQARWFRRHKKLAADLQALVWHRIEQMVDLYTSTRLGEQAIFYVPWVSYLDRTLERLRKRFAASSRRVSIRTICGSQPNKVKQGVSDDFRTGKIDVVVACKMLREGFNHKGLALTYDCAYSPKDLRSMLQKIGRLTRKPDSGTKPTSMYHYAVDSHLVLAHKRQLLDRDLLITEGGLSDHEEITQVARDVRLDVITLTGQADGDVFDLGMTGLDTIAEGITTTVTDPDGNERTLEYARAPLWFVEGSGAKERAKIEFRAVLRNGDRDQDPVARKLVLLRMARAGLPYPKHGSDQDSLATALSRYTTPSDGAYDPTFDAEIRALRPDWFRIIWDDVMDLAKDKSAKRPGRGNRVGTCLDLNTSAKYRGSPRDLLIRDLRPDWFTRELQVAQNIEAILEMVRTHPVRPQYNSRSGHIDQNAARLVNVLRHYLNKNDGMFQPGLEARINKIRPGWTISRKDIMKARVEKLYEMAKQGKPRPLPYRGTPEERKLGTYLTQITNRRSHSDMLNLEAERKLRELRPDWFAHSDLLKARHAERRSSS